MRRAVFVLIVLGAVTLAASPAAAQKRGATVQPKAQPLAETAPCACPEEAPPPLARENTLEACTDGVDNDGDGHVDCADQDCEIYAVCLQPTAVVPAVPAPPAEARSYANMRELKRDLHAGAISGHEFIRWQMVIRSWRSAEIDLARADLRAGRISHAEFHVRVEEIRQKYEG
jgi:hypothetical protein